MLPQQKNPALAHLAAKTSLKSLQNVLRLKSPLAARRPRRNRESGCCLPLKSAAATRATRCGAFKAVNASNDCLTGGKAFLQSFGGKDLSSNPCRTFQVCHALDDNILKIPLQNGMLPADFQSFSRKGLFYFDLMGAWQNFGRGFHL